MTPAVGGIVKKAVNVVDTQQVKQGDVLVVLDDTDARLALAQAAADLGLANVGSVIWLMMKVWRPRLKRVKRTKNERRHNWKRHKADLSRAQVDLQRRQALLASGSRVG